MPSEARALWFTSPGSVEIRPVPLRRPHEGEALVRTTHSGISPGTEMLAYRGEIEADLPLDESIESLGESFRYPFRYGYSSVGIVERGSPTVPEGTQVFAFHPHQDVFIAGPADLVPLDGVPSREATLYPLVETAFQIDLDAGIEAGRRVMVLGLGPVGALTALLMARRGVEVVGVDPLQWKRDIVSRLAQPGLSLAGPEGIGDGADTYPMVIEASGNPDAVRLGLECLDHEGRLIVASWFGSREVRVPLGAEFHRRRLTITSTQVSTIPARLSGEWDKDRRRKAVVELMPDLPLSVLATHTFGFDDAPAAYDAVDRREEGLIHAALAHD